MSKHHAKSNSGNVPRIATQSRSKAKFQVLKKSEVKLGLPTYKCKWVPSRNGGLMAETRVNGRVVFPDTRGPQPKNDGRAWEFAIVAENPKQTVYFAQIIVPTSELGPMRIVIDNSGKMICTNRRPIVSRLHSSATPVLDVKLANYRHASPTDKFPRFDDDFDYGDYYLGDDEEDGDEQVFVCDEVIGIEDSLSPHHKHCFACGYHACECDGTPQERNPVREIFANRAA